MTAENKHARLAFIATLATAVLLLFLFIFPGAYLRKACRELSFYAEGSMEASLLEDWPAAYSGISRMEAVFSGYDPTLRLFLDHEDVDELEGLINRSLRLAQIEEQAHLVYELESIENTLEYLQGIETFTIPNLF